MLVIAPSSVDPLPLKLRAAWCGQNQPVIIEHNRARKYTHTMTFQVAEFDMVDNLAITHRKCAAVGYEAYCVPG
jgi:hypothetical protein